MQLSFLAEGLGALEGGADPEISSLTADSRQVKPGALFAALPGSKAGFSFAKAGLSKSQRNVIPLWAYSTTMPTRLIPFNLSRAIISCSLPTGPMRLARRKESCSEKTA